LLLMMMTVHESQVVHCEELIVDGVEIFEEEAAAVVICVDREELLVEHLGVTLKTQLSVAIPYAGSSDIELD